MDNPRDKQTAESTDGYIYIIYVIYILYIYIHAYIDRYTYADTQVVRYTGRQTDRQVHRQTNGDPQYDQSVHCWSADESLRVFMLYGLRFKSFELSLNELQMGTLFHICVHSADNEKDWCKQDYCIRTCFPKVHLINCFLLGPTFWKSCHDLDFACLV